MLNLHSIERVDSDPERRLTLKQVDFDLGLRWFVFWIGACKWVSAFQGSEAAAWSRLVKREQQAVYIETVGPKLQNLRPSDLQAIKRHWRLHRYVVCKMHEAGLSYAEIHRTTGTAGVSVKKWLAMPSQLSEILTLDDDECEPGAL